MKGGFYLSHATASISDCALLYSSSLFAKEVRRCMIAGSSFRSEANCFPCKNNTLNHTIGFPMHEFFKEDNKKLTSLFPNSVKK